VIAFTYSQGTDKLRNVTFTLAGPGDWRQWSPRGVVASVGHTWFDLLKNSSVEKASDLLAHGDYGGNPHPVVCIDEFGFDFGGHTDARCAAIIEATRRKNRNLGLAVWEMRGPVPKVLAEAYRRYADLVLMECYVGAPKDYWWILTQVEAARMHGILDKTVVALGLGVGGNPGEVWATTREEIERQIRFVRAAAPESPGVAFFGGTPELLADADEVCGRLFDLPTDGSGLPDDAKQLLTTFSAKRDHPFIVGCPAWVEPDRDPTVDPNNLVKPPAMRVLLLNLGGRDAMNVTVRLKNPAESGGNVFAEGVIPVVPRHGEADASLPLKAEWKVWKTWIVEVEAPGAEVRVFKTDGS
jgi:hypothetical protein